MNIGEYSPETKSRGIFANIHEPEANNCFNIITQVIIELPMKQRTVKFYHNLPLLIRVHTPLLASTCHAMPFWTCALKKKTFSLTFIPGKYKINVIYRGLYSYPQWLRFITLFPNNAFLLPQRVERVCKSFWKENLTRTSSSFA